MGIKHGIKPASYLENKLADILEQINTTRRPVVITQNGEPRALLQDPVSYENMRNTIDILKLLSQGENDVKKKKTHSQKKMLSNIEHSRNP